MLFESTEKVKEQKLDLGDVIEFTEYSEVERRLVIYAGSHYRAIRLDDMTQGGSADTLVSLLSIYKGKKDFRIIKSENLKIVEVE